MSKLANVPLKISSEFRRNDLVDALTAIVRQVDGVTEGGISFIHNAASAAPTSSAVAYAKGDFIWNSSPSVTGTVGSQYTIRGWRCVVSGSPGTWVEDRGLTGT